MPCKAPRHTRRVFSIEAMLYHARSVRKVPAPLDKSFKEDHLTTWRLLRLRVMVLQRIELDAIGATTLVKAYATGTIWPRVIFLLQEMSHSNMLRDAHLFTAAISACESSAWHAAQIQLENGSILQKSLVAWNACVAACAAAAMWCLGLSMVRQLPALSLQKDVVSCSSAVHACSLGKRWPNALHLFSGMWVHGPLPNVVACGAAFNAASNSASGGWWALAALKRMQMQRLKPSVVCLNAALNACACSFLWTECFALLRNMQHDRLQPTMVSFGAAMSASEKVERWMDALELLTEALQAGLQPTLVAVSLALAACKHEPCAWEQAIRHLARCKEPRPGHDEASPSVWSDCGQRMWPPNLILANTLSSTCESAGKWQQCAVILASLPTWRLQAAGQTYGSFVSSLLVSRGKGKWQISVGILGQLEAADFDPDIVCLDCALTLCEAEVSNRPVASFGGQHSQRCNLPGNPLMMETGQSHVVLLRMVEECGERALRRICMWKLEGCERHGERNGCPFGATPHPPYMSSRALRFGGALGGRDMEEQPRSPWSRPPLPLWVFCPGCPGVATKEEQPVQDLWHLWRPEAPFASAATEPAMQHARVCRPRCNLWFSFWARTLTRFPTLALLWADRQWFSPFMSVRGLELYIDWWEFYGVR